MDFFDGFIQHKRNVTIGEQGQLTSDADFAQYVEEHGEEQAIGYLKAMNDFTAYAEVILGGGYCRDGVPDSGHMVRKFLRELVDHNKTFLRTKSKEFDLDFNR